MITPCAAPPVIALSTKGKNSHCVWRLPQRRAARCTAGYKPEAGCCRPENDKMDKIRTCELMRFLFCDLMQAKAAIITTACYADSAHSCADCYTPRRQLHALGVSYRRSAKGGCQNTALCREHHTLARKVRKPKIYEKSNQSHNLGKRSHRQNCCRPATPFVEATVVLCARDPNHDQPT